MTDYIADLYRELRLAARRLAGQPGAIALMVLSLGLGIGVNATLFSLIESVLWHQVPYPKAEELVDVYTAARKGFAYSTSSFPDYRDLKERLRSLSGLAAYNVLVLSYDDGVRVQPLIGEEVSGNYFDLHGIAPRLGRWLKPEDDRPGAVPAVVLGHGFWQRQFDGDPKVLGRSIRLYGLEFSVIGVASRELRGSYPGLTADFWLPVAFHRRMSRVLDYDNRGARGLFLRGRLRSGVSAEQARQEVAALGEQLARTFPDSNQGRAMTLVPTKSVTINPGIDRALFGTAFAALAVSGVVLLIACMNVAVLMLARATDRRQEIALCLALGCSRGRLVRQLLCESLLLAGIAGASGLVLAGWWGRALTVFRPNLPLPLSLDVAVDGRVVLFTLAVTLLAGLLSGLGPALQASRPNLMGVLTTEPAAFGLRSVRLGARNLLVVSQIALSTFLLVGAALVSRGFLRAQAIDPGFTQRQGVVAQIAPGLVSRYNAKGRKLLLERLATAVAALPGARAATLAEYLPLGLATRRQRTELAGRQALVGSEAPEIDTAAVGPGYFGVLGIRLLAGRGCESVDRPDRPAVVVVNETMARRFWPGESPLGKRLRQAGGSSWATVVGLVQNGKYQSLTEPPLPFIYGCLSQQDPMVVSLLVASDRENPRLVQEVRRALEQRERDLPILSVLSLQEHLDLTLLPIRLAALLLLSVGLLGLILAIVGLYSLVTHAVAQRTREVGIRIALGARSGDVVRTVVLQGLSLVACGLGVGLGLAWLALRLLEGRLYGISSHDPLSYLSVTALLFSVAALASLLPARRATRIDPVIAFRT